MEILRALMAAALAHEAVWELASETYVVISTRQDYRHIYRRHPNPGGRSFGGVWPGLRFSLPSN